MKNAGIIAALGKGMMVLVLGLLITQAVAISDDGPLKNLLQKQYKKQVLALRSPLQSSHLKFDSDGKALKSVPEAGWTIHGAILVEKLSLEATKLSLEGPWVGFESHKQNQIPSNPIRIGKSIKVEILLGHALSSIQEADTILNRVFFLGSDAPQHWLPEYRRSGLLEEPPIKEETPIKTVGGDGNNEKDKVTPPVATYTPDPEFSDEARQAKYQGTVVLEVIIDKTGSVSRIRVLRALGRGLDLKAMEAVSTWKFQPATRKGHPIATHADIEVSFRLGW